MGAIGPDGVRVLNEDVVRELGIVMAFLCLETPDSFGAVGFWYVDFEQVEDDEVVGILKRFRARAAA